MVDTERHTCSQFAITSYPNAQIAGHERKPENQLAHGKCLNTRKPPAIQKVQTKKPLAETTVLTAPPLSVRKLIKSAQTQHFAYITVCTTSTTLTHVTNACAKEQKVCLEHSAD